MLGLDFVDFVQKWQISNYVSVEDFADKFNSLFSTLLLILCALIISAKQYVMQALSCNCPKTNAGKTIEYVENFCWVTGTYAIGEHEELPVKEAGWKLFESRRINYYQWVPFMLGLQCVMFYLPHLIWVAIVTNRLGSDAQYLVTEAASVAKETSIDRRDQVLNHLANSVLHMQTVHREYSDGRLAKFRSKLVRLAGVCFPSKRLGTALVFAYLLVKLLYLANCFGQLFLMHSFLGLGGHHLAVTNRTAGSLNTAARPGLLAEMLGWDLVAAVASGRDWHSGMFPRSTLCRVRLLSVGHEVLVCQCALPVNMLNEKVYMMLWLWTLAAAFITVLSVPVWFARVGLRVSRIRFIRRQLLLSQTPIMTGHEYRSASTGKPRLVADKCNFAKMAKDMVDNLLHADGVFLFKMMQLNAGDVAAGQVLRRLYENWKHQLADTPAEKLTISEPGQEKPPKTSEKNLVVV
ncbi:hypothetical protein BOX15_Mlig025801g2 [Macrostomum lignano]|uniref:Innexin n=1 Tax=Macrostomum lignano TaxID=282301 RepID=A0A267E2I6_9PLAT|nr:hypothetical protein BOX15_Mlig025801g2 [Macrostomum lignano]